MTGVKLTIEHDEVVTLLLEALKARGSDVPERAEVRLTTNHKKGTIRLIVDCPLEKPEPRRVWVPPDCGCFNDPNYSGMAHQGGCKTPKAEGRWEWA